MSALGLQLLSAGAAPCANGAFQLDAQQQPSRSGRVPLIGPINRLKIKRLINMILGRLNLSLVRNDTLAALIQTNRQAAKGLKALEDIAFLLQAPDHHVHKILKMLNGSRSQNRQDLFVLSQVDFISNGFFVDIGASDGISISNTYLLEKEYAWRGILVEPAKCWRAALLSNRSSHIETKCVWKDTGDRILFNEIGELSTIDIFSSCDSWKDEREQGTRYEVDTISVTDLLTKYHAPRVIDYLSIDTEGSEFEILSSLDFEKYRFKVITCEHNYTPARQKIYELLTSQGYVRKFDTLSQFDDWYVSS